MLCLRNLLFSDFFEAKIDFFVLTPLEVPITLLIDYSNDSNEPISDALLEII
jgi:hypothetical protein